MAHFGAESPSGLHCTNRYESPDHPMGQSLNRQCIGSTINTIPNLMLPSSDLTKWVWNVITRQQTRREEGESTQTHITLTDIPNTHMPHVHTYTGTPIYIHIYEYTHTHTYIHAYIYTCLHLIYTYIHTSTHAHTLANTPTHTVYTTHPNTCMHINKLTHT